MNDPTPDPRAESRTNLGTAGTAGKIAERSIDDLFTLGDAITIGRDGSCNICIAHPTVANLHARLARKGEGFLIEDCSSGRGVVVNGRRVREPHNLVAGDRFGIGPFLFTIHPKTLSYLDNSSGIRLEARDLTRIVPIGGGRTKKILDGVSLVVAPGEFVSVIGRSGCGKSTFMETLNGRRKPSHGCVRLNGVDLHHQFAAFRQSIGYVPQKDIVHLYLPVHRAVYYAAQLRLPIDTTPAELNDRVQKVLERMGMWFEHRDTLISQLSGGQVKRVSLAVELLSEPPLLYIDEATSGLDPATEAKMMVLFRELADSGKSVLCITHSLSNIDQCHLVAVLESGRLVFFGPPAEAPGFFGVNRLHEVYDRLEADKRESGDAGVQKWVDKYEATEWHKVYIQDRLTQPPDTAAAGAGPVCEPPPGPANAPTSQTPTRGRAVLLSAGRAAASLKEGWHQFSVLTRRYLELVWRDRSTLRLVLMQAPVIGLILAFGLLTLPAEAWNKSLPRLEHLSQPEVTYLKNLAAFHEIEQLARPAGAGPTTRKSKIPADDAASRQFVFVTQNKDGTKHGTIAGRDLETKLKPLLTPDPSEKDLTGPALELARAARLQQAAESPDFADLLIEMDVRPPAAEPASVTSIFHRSAPTPVPVATAKSHSRPLTLPELVGRDTGLSDAMAVPNPSQWLVDEDKTHPVIPKGYFIMPMVEWVLVAILGITVFWFGCNNSAREIVKEESILGRERAAGLRLLPYLASKFLVLAVISIVQAVALVLIVYGALQLGGTRFPTGQDTAGTGGPIVNAAVATELNKLRADLHEPAVEAAPVPATASPRCIFFISLPKQGVVLSMLAVAAAAFGLLISSCVTSPDRANALTPYVLIPQILLCGAFLPIPHLSPAGPLELFAGVASPVFWANNALRCGTNLVPEFIWQHRDHDPPLSQAYTALAMYAIVLLALTMILLKRKDAVK